MARQVRSIPRVAHKFGLALECEPRGQVIGKDPGDLTAPLTDVWVLDNILSCGRFIKGANWTKYKDAAVARGADPADFIEDATYVEPVDSAVHPFMSLFDVVICNTFQHGGMTPRDCKKIKDLAVAAGQATRPQMTQRPPDIQFHGWKDDMPAGYHASTLWNHYYVTARDADLFLRASQVGVQGSWMCDPEETLAWPNGVKDLFADPPTETEWQEVGSGHNWHLDYRKANFAAIMAAAAKTQWLDYWTAGGALGEPIDHYMVHDICPAYPGRYGTATNLPTIDPDTWYAASKKIPQAYNDQLHGQASLTIPRVWTCYGMAWDRGLPGVRPFVNTVGGLMYNFNWAYALTDARFALDIMHVIDAGIPLVLGSNIPHASHVPLFTIVGHTKWPQYLAIAQGLNWAENMYIACNNEIGYLHWNESMRKVG